MWPKFGEFKLVEVVFNQSRTHNTASLLLNYTDRAPLSPEGVIKAKIRGRLTFICCHSKTATHLHWSSKGLFWITAFPDRCNFLGFFFAGFPEKKKKRITRRLNFSSQQTAPVELFECLVRSTALCSICCYHKSCRNLPEISRCSLFSALQGENNHIPRNWLKMLHNVMWKVVTLQWSLTG